MSHPLCFVLMPFGRKPTSAGAEIDFDAVYNNLIAPAIEEAGLEPIRADNETVGGIIHKPMYERLILCEYAVADLTTANANVFYELGLRHAARPRSTVLLFSKDGKQLPFDVGLLRAIPYDLQKDGTPTNVEATKAALVTSLHEARKAVAEGSATDSPVFQLVEGYPTNIAHAKTDIFREQVVNTEKAKADASSAFWSAQLKDAQANLVTAQAALQSYAAANPGVTMDANSSDPMVSR